MSDANMDSLLDKFTNPVHKRKRVAKKNIYHQNKRKRIIEQDKLFSKDKFNNLCDLDPVINYEEFIDHASCPTIDVLHKLFNSINVELINYQHMKSNKGLNAVFDMLMCVQHTTSWLETTLQSIGWKKNMSGYHPVAVSNSTSEVLKATTECVKMNIKLMILLKSR
jgi:hypothetical protein